MKHLYVLLMLTFLITTGLLQQDKPKDDANSSGPPKGLNDPMNQWMIGEWSGTTESSMGTSKDWQKCEWGLDKQFVSMTLTSKITEVNPDYLNKMSKTMKMSPKDLKEMMMGGEYKGLGMMTLDPMTGDYVGYWFDNWRGSYTGKGKLEGNTITMSWEGTMGNSVRTVEKIDDNTMVETFKEKDMTGSETQGKTTLKRTK